jgi:hypothetical protein
LSATITELARRIIERGVYKDADVYALCKLVLRRAKRSAAHVRRWRQNHVAPWRGPDREAYLAKQREYMRKYYRRRKRQGLERND